MTMHPDELQRKQLIQRVVDSPLWLDIRKEIRGQIMDEMMGEKDAERRNELFWEAQALDRIVGRLTSIANEVRLEVTNAA